MKSWAEFWDIVNNLWNSSDGGSWDSGSGNITYYPEGGGGGVTPGSGFQGPNQPYMLGEVTVAAKTPEKNSHSKDTRTPWYYGIPGVGPALESGNHLNNGNYWAATAAFAIALVDVFTLGEASGGTALARGFGKAAETGTNVVYRGLDAAGKVRYVGITEREATIRFAEHQAALGTGREFLNYEVIKGAEGLSRIDARIWEQTLINQYGLGKNGGLLLNKINSIAPRYWWQYGLKP